MADELNAGFDALVTKLGTISNLPVTVSSDPRNINPPCVYVDAPTFLMPTNVIAEMQFSVKIITNGPGDRKALQKLLELADKIRAAKIGLIDGRPTVVTIGGGEYAAYDLTIHTKVAP
jgi:hypothetical protein